MTELIIAVTIIVSASLVAAFGEHITGDALVGIYASVLGYVFGKAHGEVQGEQTESKK